MSAISGHELILNHICDLKIDFYCMKSQARFTEDFTNHLQIHYMILNKFYCTCKYTDVCNLAVESASKDHCNAKKGWKMSHPGELIFLRASTATD